MINKVDIAAIGAAPQARVDEPFGVERTKGSIDEALKLRMKAMFANLVDSLDDQDPSPDEIIPMAKLERRAINHALAVKNGNVAEAAQALGIGRATLYRRIQAPRTSREITAQVQAQLDDLKRDAVADGGANEGS